MEEEMVAINSKEFWDYRYKGEIETQYSRQDPERWSSIVTQIGKNDKVLEFGSGLGEFIDYCAIKRPFCNYTGIDISDIAVNYCKKRMPNFEWHEGEDLQGEEKNTYDVIVAQHVLEHMTKEKQEAFFKDAYELLPKGGRMIIVMPINDAEWVEHLQIWQLNDIAEMMRKKKDKWSVFMYWRSQTAYKREDGHNDNDFEEAIIFMTKR